MAVLPGGFDVDAWVDANWDEQITLREWWRRLFDAGLTYPSWPEHLGGRGLRAGEARALHTRIGVHRVIGPPIGVVAATLAAPTIMAHGTPDQAERWVRPIALGETSWCQLFSEPGAGSDLASLGTRAMRDGDEWVVTGQKVWNSQADRAGFGMLLARTDPGRPKHRGITFMVLDMDQPGISVRPLVQMDGTADFCEVFLDEARIPADHVIGDVDDGWRVAQTTLHHERAGLAGSGIAGLFRARSGPDGDLDVAVGELLSRARRAAGRHRIRTAAIRVPTMIDLARDHGRSDDAVIRQALVRYHTEVKVNGWLNRRIAAARGRLTGADGSLAKLATSRVCQISRDLSFAILGPAALLTGVDSPMGGDIVQVGLRSPGTRIGGGTDEIQRNVIGERALGLPREPSDDRDIPYRLLRVGTQRRPTDAPPGPTG